jgi:hypothetical protein
LPPVLFASRAAVTLALVLPGLALLGSCRASPAPREPDVEVLAPPPASAAPPQDLSDLPDCPSTDIDRPRGEALEDEANALLGKNPTQAFALFVESCQLRARCPHARVGAALALRALGKKARARRILDRTLEVLETGEERAKAMWSVGLPDFGAVAASPTGHRWAFVSNQLVSLRRGETFDEIRRAAAPPYTPPRNAGDGVCFDLCTVAAFSPDGRLVAWTGYGTPVTMWDVSGAGGPPVGLAKEPATAPFSLGFSPDGRLLAASLPEGIGVWEVSTRARLFVIPGKTPIAFSPDSQRLTTSAGVFAIATGQAIQQFHLAPDHEIFLIGPGSQWALSATAWHRKTQLHDLSHPRRAPRPFLPGVDLFRLAFSRDGKQAVTVPLQGSPLHLWDLESGQETLSWTSSFTYPDRLVLSPTGRLMVILGDREIVDIRGMNPSRPVPSLQVGQKQIRNHYVYRAVFSTDEQLLLTVMQDPDGVQVWDLNRRERLARLHHEMWNFDGRYRRDRKELSTLTIGPGSRVQQGEDVLFDPTLGGASICFIEREKQPLAALRTIEDLRAGYVLLADGRVEIVGPDAALAEQYLFCRLGAEVYHFALCEERLRGTNLLATLFP